MSLSPGARNRLLEQLVEFAPDALLVINSQGQVILANSTAESLFGFEYQELIEQPIERLVPQRLHRTHVQHRTGYADNPRTREMGAAVTDLVAARKDGTEFPVEVRLSPLHVDGEALTAAAVRDVSERRQVLRELSLARQEADRANADKSRFLATASHDLRQPLQALQLINAALRKQATDLSTQQMLTHESEALEAMGMLLNALLDVSKLEAGSIKPDMEDVNVAELCQALQQQLTSVAAARGLSLGVDVGAHCIRTDRTLFRQLLENLLANGVKYTEAGNVQLLCRPHAGGLRITVADSGIGIAPDNLNHIFDEFYQVQRKGRQGVGLGLAIVKRIVHLLGMTIEVESELHRGTQFHLNIPSDLVARAAPRIDDKPVDATQDAPLRALILLIEDDVAVRNATAFYLKAIGHMVVSASSGQDAAMVVQASGKVPDFILSDYHLGQDETGIDAIQSIRRAYGARIPALLLSGDTSAGMRELASLQRCEILSKPVDDRLLNGTIQRLLADA
jgi:PAS domain S-box-containing protein